ncbi:RNA polymerase sigma factor region1.1 domain-containing protein [Dankookia sp. P2]|uniref:RNA polymerase sigma factor region1.1 domain-containing protein n=1 Tax=Dankookia sp. P2 TaxID=3423955 RepID=UPI003D67AD1D
MDSNAFGPWVEAIGALVRQGKARGWVTLDEVTAALAAPEVSGELVEDLLEALAELEIEVADESEAPVLRGRFPDRLAREIGRLVRWGQERGYVTRAELLAAMPPEEVDEARFNDTVASLLGMGIRVVEG